MAYAFLSHSDKDESIVDILADRLGKEKIFYDKFNLDKSRFLVSELAKGIYNAKWFVLIATENSVQSKFVNYELNLGIIRAIQDNNYKIIVARIDNCQIPFELTPFVYINKPNNPNGAIEEIITTILSEGQTIVNRGEWSSRILNRYDEIGSIEKIALQNGKIILLWGIHGIGKTTLAEHCSDKIFQKNLASFVLTKGYDDLRLSLELCSRAKIKLPPPDAEPEQLLLSSIAATKQLINQGNLIFFDEIGITLDDSGKLPLYLQNYLNAILQYLQNTPNLPPIILASNRFPNFEDPLSKNINVVRIGPLRNEYIYSILEKWLKLGLPGKEVPKKEKLELVTSELHGYPLAARFAANAIVKFSIDKITNDLKHFQDIRIDIAKQLIGRTQEILSHEQIDVLSFLALSDTGLSQEDIIDLIFQKNTEKAKVIINDLFAIQFVQMERLWVQILPLMKDYFWHICVKNETWKDIARKIAEYSQNKLPSCPHDSEEFVHYCAMAYRSYILINDQKKASELSYYFKGELRDAVFKLYHNEDYITSLQYANLWLETHPFDKDIKFTRARCYTKLEKYPEAENELNELEEMNFSKYKIFHAKGLIFKQKQNWQQALIQFKQGLDQKRNYLPLLRDYGDVLDKIGDTKNAYQILGEAYSIQPREPFIVEKYVAVLEKLGKIEDALTIMQDLVTTFPYEASYRHRLSMLYYKRGKLEKAIDEARVAYELNKKMPEIAMHLAGLELKKGNITHVKVLLKDLPEQLVRVERKVRDTILAEICLKEDKIEEARKNISRYDPLDDSYIADLYCRIELQDAIYLISKKQILAAKNSIATGLDVISQAMEKFPNIEPLNKTRENLKKLNLTIKDQ